MAVLGVAHDLRGHGSLTTEGPAKLADDAVAVGAWAPIQVDVLAREGRASAVGAAMAICLERPDTTTEEDALELLDVGCGGHPLKDSLPHAWFLPGVGRSRRAVIGRAPIRPIDDACLRRLGSG